MSTLSEAALGPLSSTITETVFDRRAFLAILALEFCPQEVTVVLTPSSFTIYGAPKHVRRFVRAYYQAYYPNLTARQLETVLEECVYGFRRVHLDVPDEYTRRCIEAGLRALRCKIKIEETYAV